MKSPLIALCLLMLLGSCKDDSENNAYPVTQPKEAKEKNLQGAWELVSFYNYVDNKVVDSFKTNDGYRQVKIYTPSKVMWSKHVPTDSTEWFGYGSYSIEDNQLKETLDYGSVMMSKIIEERKEFVYDLDYGADTFSQIEIDEDGNRIYSENYKRIE